MEGTGLSDLDVGLELPKVRIHPCLTNVTGREDVHTMARTRGLCPLSSQHGDTVMNTLGDDFIWTTTVVSAVSAFFSPRTRPGQRPEAPFRIHPQPATPLSPHLCLFHSVPACYSHSCLCGPLLTG